MSRLRQQNCRWNKITMSSIISLVCLVVCTCPKVYGYIKGAPTAVCESMAPSHGANPQTAPNPYKITVSKTTLLGLESLNITLTSKTGKDQFKGFLIQVRKVGSDKPAGKFEDSLQDTAKTIDCPELPKSAMSHTSSDLKNSVSVQWVAPNEESAEYKVFYTVVGLTGSIFWTRIAHEEIIQVTKDMNATTELTKQPPGNDLREKWKNIYGGCGVSKSCFGIPGKCMEAYDRNSDTTPCGIMVTWQQVGGSNIFELIGQPGGGQNGYVALGLSIDNLMGQDSVVACTVKEGKPAIARYHNVGKEYPVKNVNSSLGLQAMSTEVIEGNIFCKFSQTDHKIDEIDINFNNDYYLLLAKGPSATHSEIAYHPTINDRGATSKAVHITGMLVDGR